MLDPIGGYSQNAAPTVIPTTLRRDANAVSSSGTAASAAPGVSTLTKDAGLTPRENPLLAGTGLSRSTISLLETMQAGRVTSALFTSLMDPNDSFFPASSRLTIASRGQSTTTGSTPGVRFFDSPFSARSQGQGLFANPLSSLTNAQYRIGTGGAAQPWIQDGRYAHMAYLIQIQAQRQIDQWSMASPTREWFA